MAILTNPDNPVLTIQLEPPPNENLIAFLDATNSQDAQCHLEKSPQFFFANETDTQVVSLLYDFATDPERILCLQSKRETLALCRVDGIDFVFNGYIPFAPQEGMLNQQTDMFPRPGSEAEFIEAGGEDPVLVAIIPHQGSLSFNMNSHVAEKILVERLKKLNSGLYNSDSEARIQLCLNALAVADHEKMPTIRASLLYHLAKARLEVLEVGLPSKSTPAKAARPRGSWEKMPLLQLATSNLLLRKNFIILRFLLLLHQTFRFLSEFDVLKSLSNHLTVVLEENELQEVIANLEEAIQIFSRYQRFDREALTAKVLALTYGRRFLKSSSNDFPLMMYAFRHALALFHFKPGTKKEYWQLQNYLATCLVNEKQWIELNATLTEFLYDQESRFAGHTVDSLGKLGKYGDYSLLAAYSLLQMAYVENSWLRLDKGKTRLLLQELVLKDSFLSSLPESESKPIIKAREKIHSLEKDQVSIQDKSKANELNNQIKSANNKIHAHLETLRTIYPDYIPDPDKINMVILRSLIPKDGALVAPMITSAGGAVLILGGLAIGDPKLGVLLVPKFRSEILAKLLQNNDDFFGWFTAYTSRIQGGILSDWRNAIDDITQRLWNELMANIHDQLQSLGIKKGSRVIILPHGGLSALPLHAAWRLENGVKRTFLDDYVVSYAPSASVLNMCHRRLEGREILQDNLLAVTNPTRDLKMSTYAGKAIRRHFDFDHSLILDGEDATLENLLDNIQTQVYTHLHFACHGEYDWDNPMKSALILSPKSRYSLADVTKSLDLKTVRLVVLSACETGITDLMCAPNEFIGFPAGILQAGATAVISTLWRIDDTASFIVMDRFYYEHIRRKKDLAEALRSAQLWLRDSTVHNISDYFSSVPNISNTLKEKIFMMTSHQSQPPFSHPYYWAGFTLTGV